MWPGNICDWGIKENPTEERPNTFVVYLPEGAKPGDVVEVTNEFGDKVVTRVPKVRVSVCQCAGINKINNWLTNVPTPPLIPAGTPVHEGPAQIARIQRTPDCGQAEGRRGNRDALLDGGNSQLRRGRNHVRGAARPHRGRAARRQEEDGETVLGKVANVWEAAQQANEMAGDASAASRAASKWLGLK